MLDRFYLNACMPGVWKNKLILLAVCFRVWQEGPLYFLQEACLGDFFPCELWFEFFLIRESWLKIIRSFHVRVKYLFFLFKRDSWMMTELNVIRKPFLILRAEFPAFQLFWNRTRTKCRTTVCAHHTFCPLPQAWHDNCPFNGPITRSNYKHDTYTVL